MNLTDKIILALDTPNPDAAWKLLNHLEGHIKKVKVGPALFIEYGPSFIEALHKKGYHVFLDLKLHDIPNTVALGVRGAKQLGVWMVSVHISGGREMLAQALQEASDSLIIAGITVLTSLKESNLLDVGITHTITDQVKGLALMGEEVGLKAIVSSPQETSMLRKLLGSKMLLVTPGIRAEEEQVQDQSRTLSAGEAIEAGADYLVIGRPIIKSPNPKETLLKIFSSVEGIKR